MDSRIIARNSFWYGLETVLSLVSTVITSIPIARVIGPEGLAHFLYIAWLANVAKGLGGMGIPAAERKYMAEYLNRGAPGVARAVFWMSMRRQLVVALVVVAVALSFVFALEKPEARIMSTLLIVSLLPAMMIPIPSQANMAAENMAANVPSSVVSSVVYIVAVALSLTQGWGVVGLAAGVFISTTVEFATRIVPVIRWVNALPRGSVPPDLNRRTMVFSGQSLVLMVLGLVVWDRSEFFFLNNFCKDVRQVSFYSVAFSLTEKLLLVPQVFAHATGVTLMAQSGRDPGRLVSTVRISVRYLAFMGIPALVGLALLSGPVMRVLYGAQYVEAIPVLAISAVLALPRLFLVPVQYFLQSVDHQSLLVRWSLLSAAVNIGLDWAIIPGHGAQGAALANGLAQAFAVLGLWFFIGRGYKLHLPYGFVLKVLAGTGVMAAVAFPLVRYIGIPWSLLAAGIVAPSVFFAAVRMTGMLQDDDRDRLMTVGRAMPEFARPWFHRGVNLLLSRAPLELADKLGSTR